MDYMCVFNCSDLLYLEVAASRQKVILSISPVKNRLGSGVISVSNSVITFLMQIFAGLCTGKVTLSYWMLQNTGH